MNGQVVSHHKPFKVGNGVRICILHYEGFRCRLRNRALYPTGQADKRTSEQADNRLLTSPSFLGRFRQPFNIWSDVVGPSYGFSASRSESSLPK